MIAPNIDAPTRNDATLATVNTELANSRSGNTGSAARRSWRTNSPISTTPATARPTIVGEPHAYSLPPHTATSNRHVTAPTSSAEPR